MNRTGKTDKLSVKLANNKIMMMGFEGLIGQARNFLELDKIPKDMKDLMEPIKEDVIELCRYLKQTEKQKFYSIGSPHLSNDGREKIIVPEETIEIVRNIDNKISTILHSISRKQELLNNYIERYRVNDKMINKIFDETFRDVIDQDTGKQLSTDLLQTHAERIQVAIRKMIDLIEPWSRLVHDPNIKDDRRHYLKELYDERMKNLMQFYNKSKHWPESIVIVNPENQTYSVSKTVLDDMQFYRRELESLNQGFTNDEVAMQTRQTILSEIETFLTQANLINQLGDDTFTSDTGEFNSSSLQTLTARLSQTFRTAIIAIEEYLTGQLTDPKLFKEKRI